MEDVLFDRYERAIADRDTYRRGQLHAETEAARLKAQNIELGRRLRSSEEALQSTLADLNAYELALASLERRLRAAEDELSQLRP